jgi:DNA-binding transcriptional ArsR family regulator
VKDSTRDAIDGVLGVDRLVHEPARLAILTVLSQAEHAEFSFLEMACRLSKGNLSSHLSKLEAGGLVVIEKRFVGKRPQTRAAITPAGQAALARYRDQLKALIGEVQDNKNGGEQR